jgi:acyl-CoA reductase-like NAD-dependent aldehyde dehydrogenase
MLTDIVERAHRAYVATRDATPVDRAAWLEAIASALESASDELVPLADSETHLGAARLAGELVRTVFQLRLLAEEISAGTHWDAVIDHADADWGMGPRPDIRRINEPLGAVGVFGASNFPFAFSVMGGDSASALAAGCAVVHKAHSGHLGLARRTGEIVVEALQSAGAPAGLFSVVEGRSAGTELVDHPLVKAVGFTGSTAGGRALFDRAVARPEPIPFYGELGSTNPVFVTERAWSSRRSQILQGFIGSVSVGMGQFCTKPGFLIVPASDIGDLTAQLQSAAAAVGSHSLLTPRLRDSFDGSLDDLVNSPGFELVIGGRTDRDVPAITILRTDSEAILASPNVLQHEMFGPASVIVEYRSSADLLRLAALLEGQLTSTIHAEPEEDLTELILILRAASGRVLWNGWPTGVTVSYAQNHGGPYPATTSPSATSVGTAAIGRFMRPVAYQGFPQSQLPPGLRDDNPWRIPRRVDGRTVDTVAPGILGNDQGT